MPLEFPAQADARLHRRGPGRATSRRPRGRRGPTAATSTTTGSARGRPCILPVYHPGGLLFVGDGHALQADGEPTGTGHRDVDGRRVRRRGLKKGAQLTGPRVETADEIISIGSQPEFASALDNGLKMATTDMVEWLAKDYGLEPWAAHLLIGYQGRYDVVTVAGSMALRLPKDRPARTDGRSPRSRGRGDGRSRPTRPGPIADEDAKLCEDRRLLPALLGRAARARS